MAYKTVTSLDTDKVYALGGIDGKTGTKNPTQVEGYYLGARTTLVEGKESKIHVFQTPKGNIGVWGSADTNAKLSQVNPGTMTLVKFLEKKKISGGKTKKIYDVMYDVDNTIEVSGAGAGDDGGGLEDSGEEFNDEDNGGEAEEAPGMAAVGNASAAERQARARELLSKARNK